MLAIGVAVLLALFVLPSPWGIVLVGSALAWEISEKAFWFSYTKRIPLAVGPETMVGRQVEVMAACRPEGKVRLQGERWNARCSEGAEIGDTVIVEAVEQLTLIVVFASARDAPGRAGSFLNLSARRAVTGAPSNQLARRWKAAARGGGADFARRRSAGRRLRANGPR